MHGHVVVISYEGLTQVDEARRNDSGSDMETESFSFLDRLTNLTMKLGDNAPVQEATRARYEQLFGSDGQAHLSWNHQQPVCFNFNSSLVHLQTRHVEKITNFRRIMRLNQVEVLTRASLKLVSSVPLRIVDQD